MLSRRFGRVRTPEGRVEEGIHVPEFVTGVGVQQINGRRTLVVVGSSGDDTVSINQANGQFVVHASFLSSDRRVLSTGIELLEVALLGGNDRATVAGNISLPSVMDGGDGNDFLFAGNGTSILIGGDGDDMLTGAGARDILIGGVGADRLVGNGGDDVLIGGYTSYDSGADDDKLANDAVLLKLLEEWNSGRSYPDRVANLQNGTGPVLNGSGRSLRKGVTVFDDSDSDQLTGSAGLDWFLVDLTKDKLTDRTGTEIATA